MFTGRGYPRGGGHVPPEENAYLLGFTLDRVHLLLQEFYGDFPHHNDGSHLDGEVVDNANWQRCWRGLVAQSTSWYSMPFGVVGRCFTAILTAEWWWVLIRSWNSKRTLLFSDIVITKTLGVRSAREIQTRITRQMDLWERGIHSGLVEDAEA